MNHLKKFALGAAAVSLLCTPALAWDHHGRRAARNQYNAFSGVYPAWGVYYGLPSVYTSYQPYTSGFYVPTDVYASWGYSPYSGYYGATPVYAPYGPVGGVIVTP